MYSASVSINKRQHSKKHNLNEDWHCWCRLCAKADVYNLDIYLNTESLSKHRLAITIGKCFSVKIQQDGPPPNRLCTECFSLLTFLIDFSERVDKVQKMYLALRHQPNIKNNDTAALRNEYGIFENERPFEQMQSTLHVMHPSKASKETTTKFNDDQQQQEFEEHLYTEGKVTPAELCTESVADNENTLSDQPKTDEDVCMFDITEYKHDDSFASDTEFVNVDKAGHNKSVGTRVRKNRDKISDKVAIKSITSTSSEDTAVYKYACSKCPLRFQRVGNYRVHLNKKHGITGNIPPFTCKICSRSFKSEFFLKRHFKIHQPISESELFPCPQCDRKFKAKDYVATHIKLTHERIRSFVCEECGAAIRTQDALRQHMLTHTAYAPFACEICKKCFKDRARLKKHLEIHSSKKYTCDKCGLQLNSRTTMNQHKLVHSDVMPHKCDYCGRAFKRSKSLTGRLLLHSGIKPYACEFCGKTFTSSSNCRLHMKKTHTNEFMELEASSEKKYTKHIPKLAMLKSV